MSYIAMACRILLCLVFVVSVVSKLRSRRAFADFVESLTQMRLGPSWASRPVAIALAGAEIVTALALAFPVVSDRVSFGVATTLLGLLTAGVAVAWMRGSDARCRCFGTSVTQIGAVQITRNCALLAVSALGLATEYLGGVGSFGDSGHVGGLVVAAGAGALGALLAIVADDIVDLSRASSVPMNPRGL